MFDIKNMSNTEYLFYFINKKSECYADVKKWIDSVQ